MIVHQFAIIKKCLDTVDARYKHEDRRHVVHSERQKERVMDMMSLTVAFRNFGAPLQM
jgi:hypothetical protein